MRQTKIKPCDRCGTVFTAIYQWGAKDYQKYCTRECYRATMKFTDEQALEAMWRRVDRNGPGGCWLYKGKANIRGYPTMVWRNDRKLLVHRFMYQLAHGTLPRGRSVLCLHRCDNPRCVNPGHIFLGNDADNQADMVAKRRHVFGERNSHAILTEGQVLQMRAEYTYDGKNRRTSNIMALAKRYGVSHVTALAAVQGRTWKHLNSSTDSRNTQE
jgi:hypothetical protein